MLNDGQCTGVELASAPMILEARLLSDPTTPTVMQVDNPTSAEEAGTTEVTNPHAVPTDNAGGDHVAANVVATCKPLGHTVTAGTGAPVTPPTATPPAVSPSTTQPMLTSDNTSAPDATATNVCATTSEATPSPNEAARRLACFADEVIQNTRSPLLNTPPAQQAPTKKRAMPLRSSRIASQQLAHVPTSKRGEVLLMRKMGILQNTAPPSPGPSGPMMSFYQGTSQLHK